MAVAVDRFSRESELAALRLQEQELQEQQDELLAQRLALAYACGDADAGEDVEFVMEVVADEETSKLALVQEQLAELRKKQGELEAANLRELIAEQQRAAECSRRMANAIAEQERWHAKVAEHDAAFARYIDSVDESEWEDHGDEMENPLELPPLGRLPEFDDAGCAGNPRKSSKRTADCQTASGTTTSRPAKTRACADQPSSRPAYPSSCQAGSGTTPRSSSCNDSNQRVTRPTTAKAAAAAAAGAAAGAGPSTSSGAGPSGSGSRSGAATIECLCCFDRFPFTKVTCAGADSASSSTASGGCGHYFCTGCMTEYVRGAVRDRKFPVSCPMAAGAGGQGCGVKLSREAVVALLEGHHKEMQAFGILEAEQAIGSAQRIYCPHKSCSTPLVMPENDDEIPRDTPTACPACARTFCPRCVIAGWHHGYTCAQFQALPAHLRSAEDAAMLQYSARQQWKQCPKCKEMVERSEGCNHMLCRCGSDFCYACGKPYKSKRPTAQNVHGTPACGCPLFSVPDDDDEGEEEAGRAGGGGGGAAAPGGYAAVRPVPWRGGRMVSRRRCRFSESILDCPHGRRCWFWHEVEDGPL